MSNTLNLIPFFSNHSKAFVIVHEYPYAHVGCVIYDLNTCNLQHVKCISLVKVQNSKLFCLDNERIVIAMNRLCVWFLDMDSGAPFATSFQRCRTRDLLMQTKPSPNGRVLACPKINGDMGFLRLSIPPNPLLSSIKDTAAIEWNELTNDDNYNGDKMQ